MIAASKERAVATCKVLSDHQIVRPPALTFRAPYCRGPTGLLNAQGRCADGTDTGLVGPEHRQERVGQDYGGRHQRYVKAVLYVEESLHIGAGVDVHIVVGPPGDKEPADREVRDPRPPRRAAQSPLQWCESEEQEGDTETERQRLQGSEEEEERKLSRSGLGADLGGGPDDGTQHHGRSRDEYGNGQHFHPSFHYECPPFAGRGEGLASEVCIFTRSPLCLACSRRVSADRFSSFPVDFSLCRVGL